MASYKNFTINSASSPPPWGPTEEQYVQDNIDTTVVGTVTGLRDTVNGHQHYRLMDTNGNLAVSVDNVGKVSLINGTDIDEFSIDGTMAGNSDDAVPTEKAVVTYVAAAVSAPGPWTRNAGGWVHPTTITDSVGIGTNAPTNFVDIINHQDDETAIRVYNNDSGTTARSGLLLLSDSIGGGNVSAYSSNYAAIPLLANSLSVSATTKLIFSSSSAGGQIDCYTGGIVSNTYRRLFITSAGNVGIGSTTNPATKLDVQGTFKVLNGTSINELSIDGTLAGNSDDAVPTEKAVKTYVDAQVTASDLDFAGDSGTGAVDLDSQTFTVAGTANQVITAASAQTITLSLPQSIHSGASPTFAGLTVVNAINEFSTDGTLGGNSDSALPTEKAVKTYVDGGIPSTYWAKSSINVYPATITDQIGIGTNDPGNNVGTSAGDFASATDYCFHVKGDNDVGDHVYMILEGQGNAANGDSAGGHAAHFIMCGANGDANNKMIEIVSGGGQTDFRSLNDNKTARVSIMAMAWNEAAVYIGDGTVGSSLTLDGVTTHLTLVQDDNTGNGINIYFDHDRATPANDDIIANIVYNGRTSTHAANTYANIRVRASDITEGDESGSIELSADSDGVSQTCLLKIEGDDKTAKFQNLDVRGSATTFNLGAAAANVITLDTTGTPDIYTTAWTDYSGSASQDGWSGTPTVVVHYKKVGRLVFVRFNITGTSDATNAQFELPINAVASVTRFCCMGIDNGTITPSSGSINFNAISRVELQPDQGPALNVTGWTNSGTKAVRGEFWYEAA